MIQFKISTLHALKNIWKEKINREEANVITVIIKASLGGI